MATSKLVGLVFEAWKDLDRTFDGLTPEQAGQRIDEQPSAAWTLAHVTHMVDSWINVNFQGRPPNRVIYADRFRAGSVGEAEDWESIREGVRQVRGSARAYLEPLTDADLDRAVTYAGSIAALRGRNLTLRYALMRIAVHHYYHAGVMAAVLARLGHAAGDAPGLLEECL